MTDSEKHLSFLENFIIGNYASQHALVRGFTFVLFVLLLTYSIYRLVGGEFSVRGMLRESFGDNLTQPAKNYEVRLVESDKFFATNSKGFYYIVLSSSEYYKLFLSGKVRVVVGKGETFFPAKELKFDRLAAIIEDFPLPASVGSTTGSGSVAAGAASASLIPQAWAAVPEVMNRLFVNVIEFKGSFTQAKEGDLKSKVNGRTFSLLTTRPKGMPAGRIPLVPGQAVRLGNDYYFEEPKSAADSPSEITLTTEGWLFTSISESFSVPPRQTYGRILAVRGSRGSSMSLILLSPYDLVLYDKRDLSRIKEDLESGFRAQGFWVKQLNSPQGYDAQTNALYSGRAVPFTFVQAALKEVIRHKLELKTIQYQLGLKSGNLYEIQLGTSKLCDDKPPIPAPILQNLVSVSNDVEFTRGLGLIPSCADSRAPVQRSRPKSK